MMKRILYTVLLLTSMNSFGQDTDYVGPAKMYVTNYYKSSTETKKLIEMGSLVGAETKIGYMEKSVASIKTKDPAYNVSKMESEIAGFKEDLAAAKIADQARRDAVHTDGWAALDLDKALAYLFKESNLQVGTYDIEEAKAQITTFAEKTSFILEKTDAPDPAYIRYIEKGALDLDSDIDGWKQELGQVNTKELFEAAYYEMRLHQAYWESARKIYPAQKSFEANYQKVTTCINEVGTMEQIEKIATENDKKQIADRRLKPAVLNDAALEKSITDLFNKHFKTTYGSVLKCVLLQEIWTIERNELTGVVTGRNQAAQIAYKGSDGECYLLSGVIFLNEEYVGGQFINRTISYGGHGGSMMLCENVH